MIIFDQLRISDDGQRLYINLHVNGASYFENYYLDSLTIMTSDKVLEATTDGSPTEDFIYKKVFGDDEKTADLVIDRGELDAAFNNWNSSAETVRDDSKPYGKVSYTGNFIGSLLFVYVKIKINGTPDECIPCPLDRIYTVGVTFDSTLLYQKVMDFTRQLGDDCIIPQGFTDFILLWNAFKAAIETEHFVPAIKYYNMLFGIGDNGMSYGPYGSGGTVSSGRRGCGCRG